MVGRVPLTSRGGQDTGVSDERSDIPRHLRRQACRHRIFLHQSTARYDQGDHCADEAHYGRPVLTLRAKRLGYWMTELKMADSNAQSQGFPHAASGKLDIIIVRSRTHARFLP